MVLFPTRELRAHNQWRKGEGSGPGKCIRGNHWNAFRGNLPPGSNESEASDPQFRKLHRSMNLRFRGVAMESIFEHSNAKDSIRVNSESAAKVIRKLKSQCWKHLPPRVRIWLESQYLRHKKQSEIMRPLSYQSKEHPQF
jgi:hypothetical protein